MKKVLSFLLVFGILTQVGIPVLAVDSNNMSVYSVLLSESTENQFKEIAVYGEAILYSYRNDMLSYSSQMVDNEKLQFSYMLNESNSIMSSDIYDIEELYSTLNIDKTQDVYYDGLNQAIISNINIFSNMSEIKDIAPRMYENTFDTLEDAIEYLYGTAYNNVEKGVAEKSHNGNRYIVRCKEAKTFIENKRAQRFFGRGSEIADVLAWAMNGGFGISDLVSAFSVILDDGVYKTVNDFIAKVVEITRVITRKVFIDGYSEVYYVAVSEETRTFTEGDIGWIYDANAERPYEDQLFSSITALMNAGFQVFIG